MKNDIRKNKNTDMKILYGVKTKIIILVSLISTLGIFGISEAASGIYLSASPSSLTKNVGNSFNVSVNLKTDGTGIYAVEGTVVFNNLTCENITVSNDLVNQSAPAPTCSNPYFLIGIKNGTNVDKTLFKVLMKGKSAGNASITFKNVDIITVIESSSSSAPDAKSISNLSVGGKYLIEKVEPVVATTSASSTSSASSSTIASSSSEELATSSEVSQATTTNEITKNNSFIATALAGLYNVSTQMPTSVIILLSIIVLLLLVYIFYEKLPMGLKSNIDKISKKLKE